MLALRFRSGVLCMVLAAALALAGLTGPATAESARARFTLAEESGRPVEALVRCGGEVAARAELSAPHATTELAALREAADRAVPCRVEHRTEPVAGRVDEVTYTIRHDDAMLARRTLHSTDGFGQSTDFLAPPGGLRVDIAVESLPANKAGTPLRMMAFNIWRSGLLDGLAGEAGGRENLRQLVEFVAEVEPDVLFMVETYGSGEQIVDGLNAALPNGRPYTGVRITNEPDQAPDRDNLWLFTRLEVEEIYGRLGDGDLTSFNFGGARLGLPNGQHIHAFTTWLYHLGFGPRPLNQSGLETALGLSRTYTNQQILATDHERRIGMATTLLEDRLKTYVGDDDAPVFLGGDFNSLPALDWTAEFADASGHEGLVLDWPVTRMFADAGFRDTYRWARPDAARYPGRTWSPINDCGYAPCRIDYIMARGKDVRVLAAHTITRRLPRHRGSALDEMFPFYSDHGAVVSDVLVRGEGPGPNRPPEFDEPIDPTIGWPDPPAGTPVPAAELSASASSEQPTSGVALYAVDGDPRTHWHSQYSPEPTPQPHDVTIDLGRVRTLSAVRYLPRIVGNLNGTILRAVVQASADGSTFADVARLDRERSNLPSDIDLSGVRARYLRLHVEFGVGGHSSAAEITPYELT